MKKLLLFILMLLLNIGIVNASSCADNEYLFESNEINYCINFGYYDNGQVTSFNKENYEVSIFGNEIKIMINKDEQLDKKTLYFSMNALIDDGFAMIGDNVIYSDMGIIKLIEEKYAYSFTYNLGKVLKVYKDASCLDETMNTDNCNSVLSIKPIITISQSEQEPTQEAAIDVFKNEGTNVTTVIILVLVSLLLLVAVIMVLFKRYY